MHFKHKINMEIYRTRSKHTNARVAVLMSDKIVFKMKSDKKGHFLVTKQTFYWEFTAILNMHVSDRNS